MTRRKQTQPMQRKTSEEGRCRADDDEDIEQPEIDQLDDELSNNDDLLPVDSETTNTECCLLDSRPVDVSCAATAVVKDHQMVAEQQRSPTPSGTVVGNVDENLTITPTRLNEDIARPKSSSSPSSQLAELSAAVGRPSDGNVERSAKPEAIEVGGDVSRVIEERREAVVDKSSKSHHRKQHPPPPVVAAADDRIRSPITARTVVESAITSLVNKYSLQHGAADDMTTASGRSSSVAQLESFVASVAVADCKPPSHPSGGGVGAVVGGVAAGANMLLPHSQSTLPLTSSSSSVQSAAVTPSSSNRSHSKTSKSKSSGGGGGHSSKSRSTSKIAASAASSAFSSSVAAAGAVMIPTPASMYSAIGLMTPVVPFQCAPSTAVPAGGGVDLQPLDLSTKSSRHETKYLSPDVSMVATQGPSSLLSLERQFGKGSAIFDRIGTKAWAAPYCAAAIRFGLAAYASTGSGAPVGPSSGLALLDPAAASHRAMAPPVAPPTALQHSAGSSSSMKSTGGGKSASTTRDDATQRAPPRRGGGHASPSDATSLLPWAQPPAASDQKKHSSSTSTTGQPHQHQQQQQHQQHMHTNFRCSCGASTDTLYDLTLHIQKTGHSPAPPPTTVSSLPVDAADRPATAGTTTAGSGMSSASTAATGSGTSSSSSSAATTSRPYEYSKLVRGQDVWLSGGGERTRRSILRCIECGESFRSLPELTVHMVHTRHYTNIVGAAGVAGAGSDTTTTLASHHHHNNHNNQSHHHHQQQHQRKRHSPSIDKPSASVTNATASIRSKDSSLDGTSNESPPPPKTPLSLLPALAAAAATSGTVVSASSMTAVMSPPPTASDGTKPFAVGFRSDDDEVKKSSSAPYCSDDDDNEQVVVVGGDVRTPSSRRRNDGDGGFSSCGDSRASSPAAGSTASTPTVAVGSKRPWSALTGPDDEVLPVDVTSYRRGRRDSNGSEFELVIDSSKSSPADKRPMAAVAATSVSPATPAEDSRVSPDGMSADKKVPFESKRPVDSQSSLSVINAIESFIRTSFDYKQPSLGAATPRSTRSPLYPVVHRTNFLPQSSFGKSDVIDDVTQSGGRTSQSSPSSSINRKQLESTSRNFQHRQVSANRHSPADDDNSPTDLSVERHRPVSSRSVDNIKNNTYSSTTTAGSKSSMIDGGSSSGGSSGEKKASPLTGTRAADSSTSSVLIGSEVPSPPTTTTIKPESAATRFSSDADDVASRKSGSSHGRKRRNSGERQHSKHSKSSRKPSAVDDDEKHHQQQQQQQQERPTSSTSFSRRSALESLQGLVYGQTLNTEHPLDSLQRLIYGGAAAGAATPADVGLLAEHPGASAFSTGGHHASSGAGSLAHHLGPFGPASSAAAAAFHSSLLGPQTLILVNPIVTVVSQAGSGGLTSSLSITLPGPPPAAAAAASSPHQNLISSSSSAVSCSKLTTTRGGESSSSSSSGSSPPSDVGMSAAAGSTVESPSLGGGGGGAAAGGRGSSSSPAPRVYRCRACRRKFSSKGSYRYHLSRCHALANNTTSKSPKAASEAPPATSAAAGSTVSGSSDPLYRPSMMTASSDGCQVTTAAAAARVGSGLVAAAGPPTSYAGCVPLDGAARLQTRYLAMDAGAQ